MTPEIESYAIDRHPDTGGAEERWDTHRPGDGENPWLIGTMGSLGPDLSHRGARLAGVEGTR
jgi:hypothetical protein